MNARVNTSSALAAEVVRSFGGLRLRVLGTSMAPSILPGDLVSIQRATLDEISRGEIVLFSRDGRLFVHRVVSVAPAPNAPCLITRGDRLRNDDPPVSPSEFLGRVLSIERGGRRFQPDRTMKGWSRFIQPVLRSSHLITRAYLRFLTLTRFRANQCGLVSKLGSEHSWAP